MQVVSMTEARNNFKSIFDSVYLNNDEVIVHRKDKENVVIIPFEQYNYMKKREMNYELWNQEEISNIGKIGFNSKSFVDDDEDYSKW